MIATRANGEGGRGQDVPSSEAGEPDFASSFDHLLKEVRKACARHVEWEARVAAGIISALEFAAVHPREARSVALGDWDRRKKVVGRFTELFQAVTPAERLSPISSDRAILESIAVLVRAHLVEGSTDRLPPLAPDLIYLSLMPYAGSSRAKIEADRLAETSSGTAKYGNFTHK